MTKLDDNEGALELIWGADAIAKVIGRTTRATFDMLDGGHLPARKVNGRWVIERSILVSFFTDVKAPRNVDH